MPTLKQACPVLGVKDVAETASFFVDKLGFEARMVMQEMGWAIVTRDGFDIHMSSNTGENVGRSLVYAYVTEVDALYAEFTATGAAPDAVKDQPYGMRDFYLKDPDGNTLAFGQEIA